MPQIPLTYCNVGEVNVIQRVKGNEKIRQHLLKLGLVPGSDICIVAKFGNNVIVNVKESRIAISSAMAMKIMV